MEKLAESLDNLAKAFNQLNGCMENTYFPAEQGYPFSECFGDLTTKVTDWVNTQRQILENNQL